MANCVNTGNNNIVIGDNEDKDNNDDDNDSSDNSIVHPLFMNSLPHDFSTNPHLSAIASFITNHDDNDDVDKDNEDDEDDNIRSNSPILLNHNNTDSNNDEINDENDDFDDNMNMEQQIHSDHHYTTEPSTMLKERMTPSTSTQQSIMTSNRVKGVGAHGGGKVPSVMHWKSRQSRKPYQRSSDDVRKTDVNKKKNNTKSTTTLPEAQLFLKMWKL